MEATVSEKKVSVSLNFKDEARKRLEKMKQEEMRTVRGIFKCYDTPEAAVRICQKKYKDTPVFDKTMIDGQEYEVPLYVARYLNGIDKSNPDISSGMIHSCAFPIHSYAMNAQGVPSVNVGQYRSRFGFVTTDFS